MAKTDEYKLALQSLDDWDTYLLEHSGLPGPRANLELLYAAAALGEEQRMLAYCAIPHDAAPVNTPPVFLVCCGVMGLAKFINAGRLEYLQKLRAFASDDRWRVREAVAMALQLVGDQDMQTLLEEMQTWQHGSLLEKRAVAAALCEPRLLKQKDVAEKVLQILDQITQSICRIEDRKREDFIVLKKGLSYAWSVAAAALPEQGKTLMEKWIVSHDRDIARIMKENLQKNRLIKTDPDWVQAQQELQRQQKLA